MSGYKYVDYSSQADDEAVDRAAAAREEARRQETLRLAREEAERKALAQARSELEAATAEFTRALAALAGDSAAAKAVGAMAKAAREVASRVQGADVAALNALAVDARHYATVVASYHTLVAALGPGEQRARAVLDAALAGSGSPGEFERRLGQWAGGQPRYARHDHALRLAEESTSFLRACRESDVPLDPDIERARAAIEAFLAAPDPARFDTLERDAKEAYAPSLVARLDMRRQQAVAFTGRLLNERWCRALEEWRPGAAQSLRNARAAIEAGRLSDALGVLVEIDQFLLETARYRVERLVRVASAGGGRRATPIAFDPATRTFTAEVHDEHGRLVAIRERAASWKTGLDPDAPTVLEGPREWDGASCAAGGFRDWMQALAAQGVPVRLRSEHNEILFDSASVTGAGARKPTAAGSENTRRRAEPTS